MSRSATILFWIPCFFFCIGATFAHAEKKVMIVTLPKSGTHLMRKAVYLITNEDYRWVSLDDTPYFRVGNDLNRPHHITMAHIFPEMDVVRTQFSDCYTKVLLIRDPRDVMVSFTHHIAKGLIWSSCPDLDYHSFHEQSFDEQLKEILSFPDAYRGPSICFAYAALWMNSPDVLVCRFEDLVGAQGGGSDEKQFETLKALAQHIGYPRSDEDLRAIASQLFGGTWTFREGQIGGWRSAFNAENRHLFHLRFGQYVDCFGY